MEKIKGKEKSEEKTLLKRKRNKEKDQDLQFTSNSSRETQKKSYSITKNNKRPNRKRLLKNKLEFFLSDINLYHDKYLKKIYLSHNESVSPETFLTFNSIKILLSDIDKTENKKNVIIKAVEISNKLIYDKVTNKIKRVEPYKEKLLNINLYSKCTIYIENFPPIITHEIIYDLFKDYKILYISLLKGKNNRLNGQAFITLKNIEDVPKIIDKYNNSVPKQISMLNPKELKPLKIMTNEDYLKNNINETNIINGGKSNSKSKNKNETNIKKSNNINENICVKIKNIKDNVNLKNIKNCFSKIVLPLFIDINRNEKTIILRFESKKDSDLFIQKIKENNYEGIKDMVNLDNNNNIDNNFIEVLDEQENKKYLDFVKKEIENFKEKKELKKKEKDKKLKEKKDSIDLDNPDKETKTEICDKKNSDKNGLESNEMKIENLEKEKVEQINNINNKNINSK
jgi:hypothetical protein